MPRTPSTPSFTLPGFLPSGGFLVFVPLVATPSTPALSPAPAPSPSPASSAPASGPAPPAAPSPPTPAPRVPAGAGLPAPLVALLRGDSDGPFLANEVFSVTPSQPLAAIDEPVPAPEWYAITRGRFVGVVDQFALSAVAISGVAHGARKAYTTQNLALDAFNQALTWGGVQVV